MKKQKQFAVKKNIRYKILFVIIPFFLIIFGFLSITIYFSSNNGITNIAKEFLGYRLQEIFSFFQQQVAQKSLIAGSEFETNFDPQKNTIEYAQKFANEKFLILSYDEKDEKNFIIDDPASSNIFSIDDIKKIHQLIKKQEEIGTQDPDKWNSWIEVTLNNKQEYVGIFIPNVNTEAWFVLMSKKEYFYQPVHDIMQYIMIIMIVGLIIMIVLILLFVNFLTKPLDQSVVTIKNITNTMDFSKRIKVYYNDEIGLLGEYFNKMIQELETSYNQIKNYAYQAVLAKKKEERIRFIFQKYVPKDVLEQVLNRTTDTMLIGVKQKVTILFSDIRSFTTISEMLPPEDLVAMLNNYFTVMVHEIILKNGIVDKFIGDAIMAVFGAPKQREHDAESAVWAAINMIKSLTEFNKNQLNNNFVVFETGIGINTGDAIVGNIGSEEKVDYTVIGDPVNLGARLESLTKYYKLPILISEFTKQNISENAELFFLTVDTVRVKGKAFPVKIYYPIDKKDLSDDDINFYQKIHDAQTKYYEGNFVQALKEFESLKDNQYNYHIVNMYIDRCDYLIKNPPVDWDGVETWNTK